MTAIWTVLALIVPWAAGVAFIAALGDRRSSRVLTLGAGWLVGQAMMMAAAFIWLVAFGSGHARAVLLGLGMAAIVFGLSALAVRRGPRPPDLRPPEGADAARAEATWARRLRVVVRRVLLAIIVASLLAKLYLLICSHAFIPIRNDDAVSIWLFKAKVIALLDRLPLDPGQDYHMAGSNPHYSAFIPLAAAWIPMVTGQWHEQLATLPWLFYYVNLILLIAGGLRRWMTATQSWIAAYMAGSLPLMVIHAYRPGYADMIVAAFLAGAVLYLLIWRETNSRRHLAVAAICAVVAACLKRESPALAAIAVLAVLLPSWRNIRAWSAGMRVVALAIAGVAVLIVAWVVDFSEQKDAAAAFGYHPAVWAKLWQHLFVWSSFHFLFWALGATAVAAACAGYIPRRAPAFLLTLGLCGFHAAVFLFTPQARFALNDQTPSRLFLQLAPSLVLVWGIPLAYVLNFRGQAIVHGAPPAGHKEVADGQV
jgi:hypothetical protein